MAVTHGAARVVASAIRSSVTSYCFPEAFAQFRRCNDSPFAQRLAGHALIHSLWSLPLRFPRDLKRNASFFVWVMDAGVRIHRRTLAAHFHGIIRGAPTAKSVLSLVSRLRRRNIVQLSPAHSSNSALRYALFLFSKARESFYIRTQDVFVALLVALLEQKEYLTATLLFESIVQDRALLLTLPSAVEQAKTSGSPDYEPLKRRLDHLEAEKLVPDLASLTLIADHLLALILKPSDVPDQELFLCIQSAVVLGALLDRKQLPEEGKDIVISLLRAVIRSRSIDTSDRRHVYKVYVDVEPEPIFIYAVTYAHQILVAHLTTPETTTQLELPSMESSQDTAADASTPILQTPEHVPHHPVESLFPPETTRKDTRELFEF